MAARLQASRALAQDAPVPAEPTPAPTPTPPPPPKFYPSEYPTTSSDNRLRNAVMVILLVGGGAGVYYVYQKLWSGPQQHGRRGPGGGAYHELAEVRRCWCWWGGQRSRAH